MNSAFGSIAVWVVTPAGAKIAADIARRFRGAVVFAGRSVTDPPEDALRFTSLAKAVEREFTRYDAHVFVMAAGIAVRMIAPHIGSKQTDPAVVVIDDAGHFAVSLLSGHFGGANSMTGLIAQFTGAAPVVTTATDNAGAPAIDLLAEKHGLFIETPEAVKAVSMSFLTGALVWRHDPWKILDGEMDEYSEPVGANFSSLQEAAASGAPGIVIDPALCDMPGNVLVARPRVYGAGLGCNRGVSANELICTVQAVFDQHGISVKSIDYFATIREKTLEPGMIEMAAHFDRPLKGFSKKELAAVRNIANPSETVCKHMGVTSVCEAAAMISIQADSLLIPKQKTKNTTLAVAVKPCM